MLNIAGEPCIGWSHMSGNRRCTTKYFDSSTLMSVTPPNAPPPALSRSSDVSLSLPPTPVFLLDCPDAVAKPVEKYGFNSVNHWAHTVRKFATRPQQPPLHLGTEDHRGLEFGGCAADSCAVELWRITKVATTRR